MIETTETAGAGAVSMPEKIAKLEASLTEALTPTYQDAANSIAEEIGYTGEVVATVDVTVSLTRHGISPMTTVGIEFPGLSDHDPFATAKAILVQSIFKATVEKIAEQF